MFHSLNRKNLVVFCLFLLTIVLCTILLFLFLSTRDHTRHYIFGTTYMTMDNNYFEALDSAMREIIEANGDRLITRDPAQDPVKQNDQIIDMLDMGVDLLFINPVDWNSITPAIEEAHRRGVPMINIDTHVARKDLMTSIILSDNYDAGVQIAHDVMKRRGDARIVVINHVGINSTNLRVQGFFDTLDASGYPYEVVFRGYSSAAMESAMEVMSAFLDEGKSFDVLFGGNDPTALGALAAMQQRGVAKDILVYGIDGSPSSKSIISQGDMTGSSAQFPLKMGEQAVALAYAQLSGAIISPLVYVPVKLITKDNVDQFDVHGWQ